jgi:hypothetical protein
MRVGRREFASNKMEAAEERNYTIITSINYIIYQILQEIKEYEISGACSTHINEKHIGQTKF